jgi:hypothetical protein
MWRVGSTQGTYYGIHCVEEGTLDLELSLLVVLHNAQEIINIYIPLTQWAVAVWKFCLASWNMEVKGALRDDSPVARFGAPREIWRPMFRCDIESMRCLEASCCPLLIIQVGDSFGGSGEYLGRFFPSHWEG